MKVTIRLSTEAHYTVTVPDNATVNQLRGVARVGCPDTAKLPTDFKLIYNGEKLAPPDTPLLTFNISPASTDITVILMSSGSHTPNLTPTSSHSDTAVAAAPKKAKKKSRCSFKLCTAAPLRMVGSCSHCAGKFCAKHRLLEDHMCLGLQYCKDNAHERNAMKLQSESTIASRV